MRYREIAPGAEAARFVERYWIISTEGPGPVQRVVPDGSPELILNLGDPFEACGSEGRWQLQPRRRIHVHEFQRSGDLRYYDGSDDNG